MCAIYDISPSITLKCCFRLSRCSRLQSNRTKLQHLQRMRLLRLDKTCSPCTLSWELCKARWAGEVKPKCLFDVTTRSAWHCPVYFVEASNTFPHLQRNVVGDHLILPLTKLQRLKTRKNNDKKTPKKEIELCFFQIFFFLTETLSKTLWWTSESLMKIGSVICQKNCDAQTDKQLCCGVDYHPYRK